MEEEGSIDQMFRSRQREFLVQIASEDVFHDGGFSRARLPANPVYSALLVKPLHEIVGRCRIPYPLEGMVVRIFYLACSCLVGRHVSKHLHAFFERCEFGD